MTVKPFRYRALTQSLLTAYDKWLRDKELPLKVRISKTVEYLIGMFLARWYLRRATIIGRGVRTLAKPRIVNHGTLSVGRDTVLRSVVTPVELVIGPSARLTIGHGCQLNYGVSISASREVRIGDRAQIGPYVMIIDEQFHDIHDRIRRPAPKSVHIENDVWIGAKASVMPGVRIGRGSVVAAHALVNKDVPPFSIVAGVPARVVGEVDITRFVYPDPVAVSMSSEE